MGRATHLGPSRDLHLAAALPRLAALAALVACALASVAAAGTDRRSDAALQQKLARALAVPHVNHARSAAVAIDVVTGTVLFTRNSRMSLRPASTEKLAVAYAILAALGPAFQIQTELLGDGELSGATWNGDLVLKGYGDPTLGFDDLRVLARQVRARGIRRVTGAIVGDESYFDARRTAPGWKPSYYVNESAPLSALVASRAVYRGRISSDPALAAAAGFRDALRAAGVAVPGPARRGRSTADAAPLGSVQSPPLARIVRTMGLESDNFTAEMLLKLLGAAAGTGGTTSAGAAAATEILVAAGVPMAGVRIVDGSGLSLLNRMTGDALVGILVIAWRDATLRAAFRASLPVAGTSGTLRHRLTRAPARGRVAAKTGTTALASTLSGYIGGRYAFAVLQNGPPLSSWWARQAQDRFVTVLAAQR